MRATLISLGLLLLVLGLAWPWLMRFGGWLPLGELPGDIRVERPGFRFFAPLGSSLVISIVLSLGALLVSEALVRRASRRALGYDALGSR